MTVIVTVDYVDERNGFLLVPGEDFPLSGTYGLMAFGPFGDHGLKTVRTPRVYGELQSYCGSGFHPCFHTNAKGTLHVPHACSESTRFLCRNKHFTVEVDNVPGLPYWYATDIDGKDVGNAISTILFQPWLQYTHYNVHVSTDTFLIRTHYENHPWNWPNDAVEHEWSATCDSVSGGVYHFTGYHRSRHHTARRAQDQEWHWTDWSEEPFTCTLVRVDGYCTTLLSTFRRIAVEKCLSEISLAVAESYVQINNVDYTEAVAEAANQVTALDMNNVENSVQAADISSILPIKDLVQLVHNVRDPVQWVKSGASLYLYYHYAVKPTVSDVRSLIQAKREEIVLQYRMTTRQTYRGSHFSVHGDWKHMAWAKVTVEPRELTGMKAALSKLDNLGLLLNPSRAWDLVPYSFVVDWFFNTSDVLSVLSAYPRGQYFDLKEFTLGVKVEREMRLALSQSAPSTIHVSAYRRTMSPVFPPPQLMGRKTWQGHSLEGAALIISRIS